MMAPDTKTTQIASSALDVLFARMCLFVSEQLAATLYMTHERQTELRQFLIAVFVIGLLLGLAILVALAFSGHLTPYLGSALR